MAPSLETLPYDCATTRDDLKKRNIPHMLFNSSQEQFRPAQPTPSIREHQNVDAVARFAVNGNAIVTGGTGALGLAAIHSLLEHGLSGLAIFDINTKQAELQLDVLKQRFPNRKVIAFHVDVTDENAVDEAVLTTAEVLGSIDHLMCFSGIVCCAHAIDLIASTWRHVLEVNTTGSFLCAQAVARQMIKQHTGGSITFTASISAHRVNYPQPQIAYNVSKAGVLALKNCLAAEWARYGIRTNSISPGYMDTILNDGDNLAGTRAIWAERNPTGRLGMPSELTGAVVFLASDSATYINGADIVVDGGGLVL